MNNNKIGKNTTCVNHRPPGRLRAFSTQGAQRGIASILIVILVGITMSAAAMLMIHSTRSAQEQQVASHAATHAQVGLWVGIEAFRRYLENLDAGSIAALEGGNDISINLGSSGYGNLTVKNISVVEQSGTQQVVAQITNSHGDARASSTMEIVLEVSQGNCTNCVTLTSSLTFLDDLSTTGQIGFDQVPRINVDGNVDMTNINISQLEELNATGNILLNSSVSVNDIHANGNVTIDESQVDRVRTRGNVIVEDGGARVDEIMANGNVTHKASSNTQSIESLGQINIAPGSGNHSFLRTGGTINIQAIATEKYSGTIGTMTAVGLIDVQSNDATVNRILGEADVDCPAGNWGSFGNVEVNGEARASCNAINGLLEAAENGNAPPPPNITIPGNVAVEVMNPIPEFVPPRPRVDVFTLKGYANYVVEPDGSDIKITVKNINGETEETTYYIGDYAGNKKDALCTALENNGDCVCQNPGQNNSCNDEPKYVCVGESEWNNCISYQNGLFTIFGIGIAPGIWWFDGDLKMQNGYNNGTILVTGDIVSGGQYRGAAANYGFEPIAYTLEGRPSGQRTTPYEEMCEVKGSGFRERSSHMHPLFVARFQDRYPTNLCNIDTQTYLPLPVGNIALAAGGIRPVEDGGDGTTYNGGDIEIGDNSAVFGVTLAGGYLDGGDSTAFYGYVSASVQGAKRGDGETKNALSGNTKLFFDSFTDFYQPDVIPDMGSPPCYTGCTPAAGVNSKLLWSRFK